MHVRVNERSTRSSAIRWLRNAPGASHAFPHARSAARAAGARSCRKSDARVGSGPGVRWRRPRFCLGFGSVRDFAAPAAAVLRLLRCQGKGIERTLAATREIKSRQAGQRCAWWLRARHHKCSAAAMMELPPTETTDRDVRARKKFSARHLARCSPCHKRGLLCVLLLVHLALFVGAHYYRMRHWSMPKMAKNLGLFAARG